MASGVLVVEGSLTTVMQRMSSQMVEVVVNSGTEIMAVVVMAAGIVMMAELLPGMLTLAMLEVTRVEEAAIVGKSSKLELVTIDELV